MIKTISELNLRFHISDPSELFVPTQPKQFNDCWICVCSNRSPPSQKNVDTNLRTRFFQISRTKRDLLAELPQTETATTF